MKKYFRWGLVIIMAALVIACSDDDTEIDKEKPVIDISKGEFQNCTEVEKGVPFTFTAEISDNVALGSYSFDIHHNFDHHTHSTEAEVADCLLDKKKEATHPFKLVKTFSVADNPISYSVKQTFTIPEEYEAGNYHLMFKVVDKSGWATMKGLSFRVVENKKRKEENEISKVRIVMHIGHTHGRSFHGNPQIKDSPFLRQQEMTLVKTSGSWKQQNADTPNDVKNGKPFVLLGGDYNAFEFLFYDKDGKRINKNYTRNVKRTQIFFTTTSYTENKSGESRKVENMEDLMEYYIYRDTNPDSVMYSRNATQGVELLSDNENLEGFSNLGMKGYFKMGKGRISYKLRISIVEWKNTDKPKDLDFYALPAESEAVKITSFELPLNVVSVRPGVDATEYLKEMAEYFKMTSEEFKNIDFWGDNDPESAQYWM